MLGAGPRPAELRGRGGCGAGGRIRGPGVLGRHRRSRGAFGGHGPGSSRLAPRAGQCCPVLGLSCVIALLLLSPFSPHIPVLPSRSHAPPHGSLPSQTPFAPHTPLSPHGPALPSWPLSSLTVSVLPSQTPFFPHTPLSSHGPALPSRRRCCCVCQREKPGLQWCPCFCFWLIYGYRLYQ